MTRLFPFRSRSLGLRLPRRTARLRLTALYGGLFLLSGAVLLAATYVLFERVTAFSAPALPKIPQTPAIQPLTVPALPKALSQVTQAQHALTQDQKKLYLLRPTGLAHRLPFPLQAQLTQAQKQLTRDQRRLARAVRQLRQAVHQVAQTGSVEAAQRASDSRRLLLDSGIALAVVAVLSLLAGWLVAGRMLRPIRLITRTARRISSTSLHERLALAGPEDELKELGDTLDDLFARLEAAFEAQRRFVANASHELRTPLTRERALVQVALGDPSTSEVWRSTGEQLLAANRELESLIDALLTLASSEGGLERRERTDLADICSAALERPGFDPERLGLHVETEIRPAQFEGDPRLVERLVANLADNAVTHNVADGRVHIVTDSRDGAAVLTVTNTGPAVAAADVDRLFQPFQRLDARRVRHANGHGLGLSIVRAIAAAHGATISARPLPEGGLSVSVAFPRVAHSAQIAEPVDQRG